MVCKHESDRNQRVGILNKFMVCFSRNHTSPETAGIFNTFVFWDGQRKVHIKVDGQDHRCIYSWLKAYRQQKLLLFRTVKSKLWFEWVKWLSINVYFSPSNVQNFLVAAIDPFWWFCLHYKQKKLHPLCA